MGFFSFCRRQFALLRVRNDRPMVSLKCNPRRPCVTSPLPQTDGENPIHPPTSKVINYPRVVFKNLPGQCEKCGNLPGVCEQFGCRG